MFIAFVSLFLVFSFFFLFFWIFLFCFLLYQAIFRWLASFLRRFIFVFRESTLQLKKIQINFFFLTKNVLKISRISNSKSPPWSLAKFRSEFFLVNVWRIVSLIFFSNFFWNNGKTITDVSSLKSDTHLPKKFVLLQWKSFKIDEKCFSISS